MKFTDFALIYSERPFFTARDVRLRFPDFNDRQLRYWQQQDLVHLLRRPFYRVSSRPWTLHERWVTANQLYAPSYISLETALSYHGLIPEGVFHITSITTRNTRRFDLDHTSYFYQNVKPEWFFGYALIEREEMVVRMATMEKALLDLLHLNPRYANEDDFDALRLDRTVLLDALDLARWNDYLSLSTNKALGVRANTFQQWLHDIA